LKKNFQKRNIPTYLREILRNEDSDQLGKIFKNNGTNENEQKVFSSIVSGNFSTIKNKSQKECNYYKNYEYIYNYFKENFKNEDPFGDYLNSFINFFEIGVISFNKNSITHKKEMEIFQNLNTKGTPLNEYDVIKNYIFNLCSDKVLESNETRITEFYQKNFENRIDKIQKKTLKEFLKALIYYLNGEEIKIKEYANIQEA
jgi:hypothetical protein